MRLCYLNFTFFQQKKLASQHLKLVPRTPQEKKVSLRTVFSTKASRMMKKLVLNMVPRTPTKAKVAQGQVSMRRPVL